MPKVAIRSLKSALSEIFRDFRNPSKDNHNVVDVTIARYFIHLKTPAHFHLISDCLSVRASFLMAWYLLTMAKESTCMTLLRFVSVGMIFAQARYVFASNLQTLRVCVGQ